MECLGRSITPKGQAFAFASLCLAHHIILSYQKTLLPLLFSRVFLFSGQTWACDLRRLFLPDSLLFSGFSHFFQEVCVCVCVCVGGCLGGLSSLKQIACNRFIHFKDSTSVSLKSSSNVLGAGIPPRGPDGRGPEPALEGYEVLLSSKRTNSVMGCLCQCSKLPPDNFLTHETLEGCRGNLSTCFQP